MGRVLRDFVPQADLEALADAVVALSGRPEVAAAIRPDLPGILRASIATAHVPGPIGMGERQVLLKLAGVRLAEGKDAGSGKAASMDALGRVADRLERASGMRARVVEAAFGADRVTEGAAQAEEPPESLAFGE